MCLLVFTNEIADAGMGVSFVQAVEIVRFLGRKNKLFDESHCELNP